MSENELPPWPWQDGEPKGEIIKRREDACVGAWVLVATYRRVYAKDATGRSVGGPLPRYEYGPMKIVGETKFSWLIGNPDSYLFRNGDFSRADKFPKKRTDKRGGAIFYGIDDVEDAVWLGSHSYRIAERIRSVKDVDLLRRVAQIVGYNEERAA